MQNNFEDNKNLRYLAGLVVAILAIVGAVFNFNNNKSVSSEATTELQSTVEKVTTEAETVVFYTFRNEKLLSEHYEKHGKEMGFSSAAEYEKAAAAVVNNKKALHKQEAEDGDDVYYVEETNEFVIVSTDGYIRTYFNPNSGINYYNRQ